MLGWRLTQEVSDTLRHTRATVIERTIREFERLDQVVAGLAAEVCNQPLRRGAGNDPWTGKDALVHSTHWKANTARVARKQRRPPEARGLEANAYSHLISQRWRDRAAHAVLAWHRQVQEELLTALREAPDEWFAGKERGVPWPVDIDGHAAEHRVNDIERTLADSARDDAAACCPHREHAARSARTRETLPK